jgi:hypothetical protein
MVFFELFDIGTAVKYSTLFLCTIPLAAVMSVIMPYIFVIQYICCWTIRIDADDIVIERQNFWNKSCRRAKRNEILSVEKGCFKLFSKEQLTFRYWLDRDPVWNLKHIRLNTPQHTLAIPCRSNEEQQWLLRVIQKHLEKEISSHLP